MTGLSSQHISGNLAVPKSKVEKAFIIYDSSGAPEGYGTPKRYLVRNPKNDQLYPQKTIYGIALQHEQKLCPSATDTRFALEAAGFEIVDLKFEGQLKQDFQKAVEKSALDTSSQRRSRLAIARTKPEKVRVSIIRYIRNQDVVAERLFIASGSCEQCCSKAPFLKRTTKKPYLEVHHIIPLAENGDDTVENTRALCPNCHRKAHHG